MFEVKTVFLVVMYRKTILIIEDEPSILEMYSLKFQEAGFKVITAKDGKESVEMYMKNRNQYDIVFMDIQMPVMNGVDATKAIIKYEKKNHLTHTPIVAVTTNALKGDRERYLAEGMDEYIAKPIDLNKFMAMVQEIGALKDKIRDLEDVTKANPYQKVIFVAQAVDSWRIFPRAFLSIYMFLLYYTVMWFMDLPDPSFEQSGLISIVVGSGAAWFGLYAGTSGSSKSFKGEKE